MNDCPFCAIAAKTLEAVIVWEDDDITVFLDRCAVREAHCQIIAKYHYETFEQMPATLAGKMVEVGQRLARRIKEVYPVERVAFLFTGGDVPHVHAHVIPMHEKTDITSGQYIVSPEVVVYGSDHLLKDKESLEKVRSKLRFVI